MKYWFVIVSIHDGEYEYFDRRLAIADTREEAVDLAIADNLQWTETDYRGVSLEDIKEIPKEHFDIVKEYIYTAEEIYEEKD